MPFWLLLLLPLTAAVLAPFSALAALLLLPLALAAIGRGWPDRGSLSWILLGWLIWLPVSLAFSLSPGLALPQAAVLLCLPLAWLAGQKAAAMGQLDALLTRGLPLLLVILLAWGLAQGPATITSKPQGPFNDPNTYAAVLNMLMLPVLARYLAADLSSQAGWRRVLHLALLAACALVSFLVSSRGATLALLLVMPLLLWTARSQPALPRKLALLVVVVGVSYLAALHVTGGLSVATRLVNTVQGGDPSRLMLLQSAWQMIQDHPWLGTGLGSFRLLYPQYRLAAETGTAGGWVHNDYLQLWLEAGLPMLMLLLAIALWVGLRGWRALGEAGQEGVLRLGYLAGIAVILLHALVNFLFFYALVSMVLGLYLACLSPPARLASGAPPRAWFLAAGGYGFILGWLLLGQVAVEGPLGHARAIQRAVLKWGIAYPRYEVAYWVSVLAPFHPTPQQVMGLELAEVGVISGGSHGMLHEALDRMDAAWAGAPCYIPYGSEALAAIRYSAPDLPLRQRGLEIARRNLECDPRHGLSHYYAGMFAGNPVSALRQWHTGLEATPYLADRLLLATTILARTTPGQREVLSSLADDMALAIKDYESRAGVRLDPSFWSAAQYKLYAIAGPRYLELVPPSSPGL